MFKVAKFIKNIVLLNRRLTEEKARQKLEGHEITFVQEGPEQYITYHEGDRRVTIAASFSYLNDVVLYTNSFKKWDVPPGHELTPFDYQKVLNRLVRYFSCWGEVTLDDSQPQEIEDLRESLIRDGIPFEELEGGIIRYKFTVEEERTRKGGFFD